MTTDSDGISALEERLRKRAYAIEQDCHVDDADIMVEAADALRTVTAERDEAISLSVYFRQATEAAEARLEELTRERDAAVLATPTRKGEGHP